MVKARARPRSRAMALLAGLRESTRDVVGIRRPLEVFQVATHASRVRAREVVVIVDVALHALHRCMRTRQRESGSRVVEGRARPRRGAMALLAGLGESSRDVVWIGGSLEVRQVAADAGRVRAGEVVVIVDVALHALHGGVCARQGNPVVEWSKVAPFHEVVLWHC